MSENTLVKDLEPGPVSIRGQYCSLLGAQGVSAAEGLGELISPTVCSLEAIAATHACCWRGKQKHLAKMFKTD